LKTGREPKIGSAGEGPRGAKRGRDRGAKIDGPAKMDQLKSWEEPTKIG
jgi:hypothetical protein